MTSNRPTLIDIKNREGFPDENSYLETVSNEVWFTISDRMHREVGIPIVDITIRILNRLKEEKPY